MQLLLGTYTKKDSEGIYSLELDVSSNECKGLISHLKIDNPTYIALDGSRIFSVCSKDEKAGLAYFNNGVLVKRFLNETSTPCYVSYDSFYQMIFTANYHQGQINTYHLVNDDLESLQKIVYPQGSKAHFVQRIINFNAVFVCDLGLDKVYVYGIDDRKQLELKQTIDFEPGCGPRHLVSHPTMPMIYVLGENTNEVFIIKFIRSFEVINKISANPDQITQNQHAAAIRISKDGKFLYTSNRADHTISVFKILDDGQLMLIQTISTYGTHPRDFNLSPDQNYLLAANLLSDSLTLFRRDRYTGKLSLIQKGISVYEPTCVVFR